MIVFLLSLVWDRRTVIFQRSDVYCRLCPRWELSEAAKTASLRCLGYGHSHAGRVDLRGGDMSGIGQWPQERTQGLSERLV